MHGAGNDFVFLDCLKQNIPNLEAIAKKLCDRRFGIGADQLLTVHPSKIADFKMEIYNADGSQVEMCGNGIRCFAKYVYDHGITTKRALEVETLAGIIRPRIVGELVEVGRTDSIFIKPAAATAALVADLPQRPPYPGAKLYPVADELLDDPERLQHLLLATWQAVPASKARNKK